MTSPTPTIHALHGFLGSGKTTLARKLERELSAMRFSSDEWMTTLYGQDPPAELFGDYRARVLGVMRRCWVRALELGLDVVLDEGLWTRAERDALSVEAEKLGAALIIYALNTPEGLARERIRRRNAQPGALFIAENTYDLFRPRFEPLDEGEKRVEVE